MSLGAAGDLVRRLKAQQAEARPAIPEEGAEGQEAPSRPALTIVGSGVKFRG